MGEEKSSSGSWWTTLPGILTGLAALITAVGGLITILVPVIEEFSKPPERQQLPDPGSNTRQTSGQRQQGASQPVDGVWVSVVEVRRGLDQNRPVEELHYRIRTGASGVRHNPGLFVRRSSNGDLMEPIWAPPPFEILPNSEQHIRVLFAAIPASSVVFRFGVERPVMLSYGR